MGEIIKPPYLGFFQLELPSAGCVRPADIDWLIELLSWWGYDALRIFDATNPGVEGYDYISPMLKDAQGYYLIRKPNPRWLDRLIYISRKLHERGMFGIMNLHYPYAIRYRWYPWRAGRSKFVRNGKTTYPSLWATDADNLAAKEYYCRAIREAVGPHGFTWSPACEMNYQSMEYAGWWAYCYARILKKLGMVDPDDEIRRKPWISGYHKIICGALTKEVKGDPYYGWIEKLGFWPDRGHVCIWHAVDDPSKVSGPFSARPLIMGISNDGNRVEDPIKRGHCEIWQKKRMYCAPNAETQVAIIRRVLDLWFPKNPRQPQENGRCMVYFETHEPLTFREGLTYVRRVSPTETLRPLVREYRRFFGEYPPNWHKYPRS